MLGDSPLAYLHGVKPGPMVDFVAIVEIYVLFDRSRVNTREAPDGSGKKAVGRRPILSPQRHALAPIAIETPAVTVIGAGWVHQASESPFAGSLPVWRQRSGFSVFDGGILPERTLGGNRTDEDKQATRNQKGLHQTATGLLRRIFSSLSAIARGFQVWRSNSKPGPTRLGNRTSPMTPYLTPKSLFGLESGL